MALDRQDIEKKDFPIGRRGYDPDAVDLHLRAVADELEAVRQAAPTRGPETLAAAASEQVRAIVEAAETSAGTITREAEQEARQIRQKAGEEADSARDDAAAQAREHVTRVSEATAVMLQRVDAMETELGALVESLRTGANRLTADLALLQGNMGELRSAGTGAPAPTAAPVPETSAEAVAEQEAEVEPVEAVEEIEAPVEAEAPAEEEAPVEEAPAEAEAPLEEAAAAAGDDSEGARLIALNMALNGTPREETDRYLAENFDLADREALLDEVYARVG